MCVFITESIQPLTYNNTSRVQHELLRVLVGVRGGVAPDLLPTRRPTGREPTRPTGKHL